MKVKTMKQLKEEILEKRPDYEIMIKHFDRFNVEAVAEQLGIDVFTKDTNITTFERLIGYDFGSCILEDIARVGATKQYIVKYPNGNSGICLYKEFKELIKHCDYPKR